MNTKEKFQEAFDKMMKDFNEKVEEVKSNVETLTKDVRSRVEDQRGQFEQYAEKLQDKYGHRVDTNKIRDNFLAETENILDEVKVKVDKLFDYVQHQLEERKAETAIHEAVDKFGDTARKVVVSAEEATDNFMQGVREAARKARSSKDEAAEEVKEEAEV